MPDDGDVGVEEIEDDYNDHDYAHAGSRDLDAYDQDAQGQQDDRDEDAESEDSKPLAALRRKRFKRSAGRAADGSDEEAELDDARPPIRRAFQAKRDRNQDQDQEEDEEDREFRHALAESLQPHYGAPRLERRDLSDDDDPDLLKVLELSKQDAQVCDLWVRSTRAVSDPRGLNRLDCRLRSLEYACMYGMYECVCTCVYVCECPLRTRKD